MRIGTVAVALALLAGPAGATGDILCAAPDGSARVALGVGHLPVLAVISARIEAGGRVLSTAPGAGETAITVGQAYRDGAGMAVAFTDPNVSEVVAELRTLTVSEGRDHVEAGWLRLPGESAHPLLCEGF